MITRFHVENFKALKDVTLDFPNPIHVLIGPNDSGTGEVKNANFGSGSISKTKSIQRKQSDTTKIGLLIFNIKVIKRENLFVSKAKILFVFPCLRAYFTNRETSEQQYCLTVRIWRTVKFYR
jgi:hypothetical protein